MTTPPPPVSSPEAVPRLPGWKLGLRALAFVALFALLGVAIFSSVTTLLVWTGVVDVDLAPGTVVRAGEPGLLAIVTESVMLLATLIATAVLMRRDRLSWTQIGLPPGGAPAGLAVGLAIGLAEFALVPLVAHLAGWATITRPLAGPSPLTTLGPNILTYLTGAAFEETATRGLIFTLIAARSGPAAVAISSVVFTLPHLNNPGDARMAAVGIFVAGVVLALVRLRTGALWIPIGWHMGWNLAQGWLFGCSVSGGSPDPAPLLRTQFHGPAAVVGDAFGPESGWLAIAVDILTLAVFMRVVRPGSFSLAAARPGDHH